MNERIRLNKISTITQKEWLKQINGTEAYCLFITASGYEARNIHWVSKTLDSLGQSEMIQYLVVGFRSFQDILSRPKNDNFYREHCLSIKQLPSDEWIDFQQLVESRLMEIKNMAHDKPIEVHVDYSCMPRIWYCRLPSFLEKNLRSKDQAYFWYSPGKYPDSEYPTAGVEDFHVFSGKASLSPTFRTHMFGLGFDRIRSQAIWSVLDPEHLVCFYTDPGSIKNYVRRVKSDNRDILMAANYTFSVPMHDFVYTYSKITGIVREFRNVGDVVLVPDGPKPLILAASIVPFFLNIPGIVCFHVSRRKNEQYKPVDVEPKGEPYGFFFHGPSNEY